MEQEYIVVCQQGHNAYGPLRSHEAIFLTQKLMETKGCQYRIVPLVLVEFQGVATPQDPVVEHVKRDAETKHGEGLYL